MSATDFDITGSVYGRKFPSEWGFNFFFFFPPPPRTTVEKRKWVWKRTWEATLTTPLSPGGTERCFKAGPGLLPLPCLSFPSSFWDILRLFKHLEPVPASQTWTPAGTLCSAQGQGPQWGCPKCVCSSAGPATRNQLGHHSTQKRKNFDLWIWGNLGACMKTLKSSSLFLSMKS